MIAKDIITKEKIEESLRGLSDIDIEIYGTLDSTNTVAVTRALSGCREWHTVIAGAQTAGQGRLGRSFFSPGDTGIYMSTVLFPMTDGAETARITGIAALAAADAVERECGVRVGIKWVNDIYKEGKKVAGILAKSVFSSGSTPSAVILGIGINVYRPDGDFPEEIRGIAGFLSEDRREGLRSRICASFLSELYKRYSELLSESHAEEYRERCITLNKRVLVRRSDGEEREATAISVDSDFRLLVEYPDGKREYLYSGEVSAAL